MDELINQGQWWWLLVVPVATGVLALFGSWWGSRLGKTTEHTQWLRNEKIETYSQYVETIRRGDIYLNSVISGAKAMSDTLESNDHTGGSRLRLISPKSVRDAAESHIESREAVLEFLDRSSLETSQTTEYKAAHNKMQEARKSLTDAMSRDLGITD
ncbi:hypothetical protein [Arthrobacter sp. FW306-04-A]|uniref:hypothetical protein n=1 Tax=Arthrobacter sp. FW306-04-A TaxID=2879619 RepID=UPI0037C0ED7C|nr:hypothetical protein LFT43_12335 [Arthrobacter sp. FW306-04-A]